MRRVVSFSEPQLSPDGKLLVYLRSKPDFAKDRNHTDLMLMNIATRRSRNLTWDRRGLSGPRWSPQGDRIAFVASAQTGKEEQEQIFVMPLNGGDPRQVTSVVEGVQTYSWSPDGMRLAFITADENPDKVSIAHHLDAFEVGSNDYLHQSASMPSHLWTVSAGGGRARRLTHGAWSLGTVDPDNVSSVSWSPDGEQIAVVRFPTPLYGDSLRSVIELVSVRSGATVALTGNSGLEGEPQFAPRGAAIAYARNSNGDPTAGQAVYVTRRGAGAGSDVRREIDRNINGKVWTAAGDGLWLYGPDRTRSALWFKPLAGAVKRVNLENVAFSRAGNTARNGAFAFVGTTSDHPSEIYMLASPSARPVALTNDNVAISRLQLARVTGLTWRSGGFEEDGILTFPPSFDKLRMTGDKLRMTGRRFPLVLLIHGGPQSASTEGWSAQRQLFAARGYAVFEPNYRGSTNLGDRYQRAISHDAGVGPGNDVMAGLAAVRRLGFVDPNRIAVSGWSYGGYMTSWLIGHSHIWKAAVSGAALNDWVDDYSVAFYVNTDVPFFGGSPWNPKYAAMWRAQSPMAFAPKITTPTLIMGDIGDNNVTITNSFKMYHALKDNGVPTEFFAYPVHGHFPSDPVRSEDVTRHWIAWLDRYLR
ncbi:MAG: S9 family peptidase [Candidatus Eremiobacteraeota bacterium]|nr:S9 family peptidase [Candidatus Eremiobacteraeota bacterium]